ncbi:MAG: hypothetical protein PVH88_18740 [Ignavibacteria bacterium]|jgi:hypothetical protein
MDINKQYILQSISYAANNLRLSSDKIEAITLIKEYLANSENLQDSINTLKKTTQFSKLAIKLGDINNFISKSRIDFLKLSDQFKEHTSSIIQDLSNTLDTVTPEICKEILFPDDKKEDIEIELKEKKDDADDSSLKININDITKELIEQDNISAFDKDDIHKEEFTLNDLNENDSELEFENFEKRILKPIKEIDEFLNKLSTLSYNKDELIFNTELMNNNAELSEKIGFEIISNMHKILAEAFSQLRDERIIPDNVMIEELRACLIVIAAVVRRKEVDISNYLNKSEKLGKKLKVII